MEGLLEELDRACDQALRLPLQERLASAGRGAKLEAEFDLQGCLLRFSTSVTCLLMVARKRERLDPHRRLILEEILGDSQLRHQLQRLLTELRPMEMPQDILYCVMQHGYVAAALGQHLDRLFEGLDC
jgi:hypothetical protein